MGRVFIAASVDTKRRRLLKNSGLLFAAAVATACGGGEETASANSPTPPPPAPSPTPPPPASPTSSFYFIPSLQDEQDFYTNVLGWTWTAEDKLFNFVSDPGVIGSQDVHDATEADDLWTWYQQERRGYGGITPTWRARWLTYFKDRYLTDFQSNSNDFKNEYCHVYGTGLCLYGAVAGDASAITAAEAIGDMVVNTRFAGAFPNAATEGTGYGGGRSTARMSTLFSYLAEATGKAKWAAWRDAMIDVYLQSPDWQEAPMLGIVQGGAYFCDRNWMDHNGQGGVASYDAGRRSNATFEYGLHAEFLWRAFLQTRRADVRDRLIKFARFMEYYAHIPTHTVPFTGAFFGHQNGARWHREASDNSSNSAYDASVVNILTWGYKLTGDANLLNRAKIHFRQATRWQEGEPGGTGRGPEVGPMEVESFIDTRKEPGILYFTDNKGQLQYVYQLLESGGNPTTEI